MGVAYRAGAVRLQSSPREPALRKARVCYDHLAGDLGVRASTAFEQRVLRARRRDGLELTAPGRRFCRDFGIDLDALAARAAAVPRVPRLERAPQPSRRRARCRDPRPLFELGWARASQGSRVVRIQCRGRACPAGALRKRRSITCCAR